MARAVSGDFLQNFAYHVRAIGDYDPFDGNGRGDTSFNGADAGFQNVTMPEMSMDAVEYREGNTMWTAKQLGIPTVSETTLMQGVVKGDSLFFDWFIHALKGDNQYRIDMKVEHYHRDEWSGVTQFNDAAAQVYYFFECMPIRNKPTADFDSTATEVAVKEIDVAMERFSINEPDFK
jgi:phage tail-like protein